MKQFNLRRLVTASFLLSSLFFYCSNVIGQGISYTGPSGGFACGVTANLVAQYGFDTSGGALITTNTISQTDFEVQAIDTCGKFRIFYEDLLSTNPKAGFSDSLLGAARRSTYCAALTYIQSVFDFSNISSSDLICIYVVKSYAHHPSASNAPTNTIFYAEATPYFTVPGGGGVVNGYVNDYMRTGTNPSPGGYHAQMLVNFDTATDNTGTKTEVTFQDDYSATFVNCKVDLFSTLLHETTHALGWISLVNFVQTTAPYYQNNVVPTSQITNVYSGLDTSIYVGTVYPTTSLTKLISSSLTINSGTNASNDYWINSFPAPDNYPAFSGNDQFSDPAVVFGNAGLEVSYLSHLDYQTNSYALRQRISPGEVQDYVMSPYGIPGHITRQYTKAEILSITRILNIGLNSTLNSAHPEILANHPPFSTKMAGYTAYYDSGIVFPEVVPHDFQIVNDGSSLVINLYQDPTLSDADGDSIRVMPGTLINFRGCGSSGNNHAQLSLSNNNKTITFTPRANFIGRAQFGFDLWDGKEKGGYMIYTIDVTKGSNVSYTAGDNMVLNGTFEEGTETRTTSIDTIPNATQSYYGYLEGKLGGINFSDSHPFNHFSNGWAPYGSGIAVHNSFMQCDGTTFTSSGGSITSSWFSGTPGNFYYPTSAASSGGERFQVIGPGSYGYYTLAAAAKSCNHYTLEFDASLMINNSSSFQSTGLKIGFLDSMRDLYLYPAPTLKYSIDTFFNTNNAWQHITISFWYCGSDTSRVLCLKNTRSGSYPLIFIDNLSLKQDLTPPSLSASISQTAQSSCNTLLSTTVTNKACSISHKWSTGATTSSITVSSNTSAIYHDTVSDGCRTYVASTTVSAAMPSASISAGSATSFCPGGSVTLTASPSTSGLSFQWKVGGTNTGTNSSTYTTGTAGSYTVTITDSHGCSAISSATSVTIYSLPTATITQGSAVSICAGNTLTLNAATATGLTYKWFRNTTYQSSATTSTYTESSMAAGTYSYTLVVINSNGCTDTSSTTTVTVSSGSCNAGCVFTGVSYNSPSSITSSITGTSSTRYYYIGSNMTIGTGSALTIDLSGLIVFVAPNVVINIAANTTLILDSCHFFSCSGSTWGGFTMSSSSTIHTRNYTLIEDAYTAITASSSTETLIIDNTTFNHNLIGIYIASIFSPGSTEFQVTNSIFTCREFSGYSSFPFSWPHTSTLNSSVTRTYTYQAPYLIDRDYAPKASPVSGTQTNGINIYRTGTTSYSSGYSFSEVQIGDPSSGNRNLFDALSTGIWLTSSNCASVNNAFIKNNIGVNANGLLYTTQNRVRVYTPSGSTTNDFYGCAYGLDIASYPFVTASKMNMFDSTKSIFPYGINQTGKTYQDIDIENNTFYNQAHGVALSFGGLTYDDLRATSRSNMTITISNNTMTFVDSGISLTNAYNCPFCQRVRGTQPFGTVNINYNTIAQAINGIILNSLNQPNTNLNHNTITLSDKTGAQYGIKATSSVFVDINNDSVSRYLTSGPSKNDQMRAFYVASSNGDYVGCNSESYTGRGFEFEGSCLSLKWVGNDMFENNKGFVVSTGLIGKQYTLSTYPAGNRWGKFFSNPNAWLAGNGYQTWTQNHAKAINSPLNYNNADLTIEKPANNNGQYPGAGYIYSDTSLYSTTGTFECAPTNNNGNVSYITIAQNGADYGDAQPIDMWKAQFSMYQSLLYDSTLVDTSLILGDFYTQAITSRYGILSAIEGCISIGNTDSAQSLIDAGMSALSPTDPDDYGVQIADYSDADGIVSNYLTYYQIGINYMTDNLTSTDYDNLLTLVYLCPMTDGDVVYQARALYNILFEDAPFWDDDPCMPDGYLGKMVSVNPLGNNKKGSNQNYSLYPNPNNGNVSVTQKLADTAPVNIEVLNSKGQTVYKGTIQFNSRKVQLNLDKMIPGLYLMHILDTNGKDYILNFIVNE